MRRKVSKQNGIFLSLLILGFISLFFFKRATTKDTITDFISCVSAGNPVLTSYPAQCKTSDGRTFTEVVPTDTATQSEDPATQQGNIVVTQPKADDMVTSSFTVEGKARVFENVIQYRLRDQNGTILAADSLQYTAPDAGQFGDFSVTISYTNAKGTRGMLEVFSSSPKDGSEINKVSIPVQFAPSK